MGQSLTGNMWKTNAVIGLLVSSIQVLTKLNSSIKGKTTFRGDVEGDTGKLAHEDHPVLPFALLRASTPSLGWMSR